MSIVSDDAMQKKWMRENCTVGNFKFPETGLVPQKSKSENSASPL